MKNITCLLTLLALYLLPYSGTSQILNQSASWPNATWTISGTYNAVGFASDPTITANFSYDDDLAGNASFMDDISAESAIIDLTAAFNGNDIWIQITSNYTFRNSNDDLDYEYWDADAVMWIHGTI